MSVKWPKRTLGEVCSIARGGSPRPIQTYLTEAGDGINWVKISDATASGKYIYTTAQKIKPAGASRSRVVKDGDFLLSNSMSFGRPYIMRTTGCIHDGWLVLSNYEGSFDQDFMYHLLGSPQVFDQFDRLAAGSTVRNLNIELARRVLVPVPPLDEQQRIVAILDEAFAGIATAKANAERNLRNAREVFERHLQKVFTERDAGWVKRQLDELVETNSPITYGVVKPGEEGEIRFVRGGDLVQGKVRMSQLRTISRSVSNQYSRTLLQGGELLICLVGQPGQVAVAPEELAGSNIARQVGLIRLQRSMNAEFARYFLQSTPGKEALGSRESGSVQQVINLGELRNVLVPCPDLDDQNKVVEELDAFGLDVHRVESIYTRKLTALDELKHSLLHQAFSGKL